MSKVSFSGLGFALKIVGYDFFFYCPCIPICRSESSKETGVTVMTTGYYYYCIIVPQCRFLPSNGGSIS